MEQRRLSGITELAKSFSVSLRTIRFYEEKGLIKPSRTKSGRRVYGENDVTRLDVIVKARRCGFSLSDIAEVMKNEEGVAYFPRSKIAAQRKALIGQRDVINEMIAMLETLGTTNAAFEP